MERPVLQPVLVVDILGSDYHWGVKQVAAPVAPLAFVDNHLVVEVVPADSAAVVPLVVEVAPADSVEAVPLVVEAVPQASAAAALVDIDMVAFAKVPLDFENCPARACLAVAAVAELARWDHIDYDIDLAWSILFCIHAINNNEAI